MSFLGRFFKNNTVATKGPKENTMTDFDKKSLDDKLNDLRKQLECSTEEQKADILCKIGNCYFTLNETDFAIKYYELCLDKNSTADEPRMNLLRLYNIKRKQAAMDKNDDMIQTYLDKIDNLMKLNKDIIRKV